MAAKVLVLGGNFGGLTAAIGLKHELEDDVDVTVISASDKFLFNPSLIWLPFGKRKAKDITFKLQPTFENEEVHFVHAEATGIDPKAKKVTAGGKEYDYDYLIIATGYRNNFDAVPGLGGDSKATTISTLEDAQKTGENWKKFLKNPGPIIIGATQSAGCFGAAYEFLFNTSYQLKKNKIRKEVQLTYVSSEPFLGHFGIGGMKHGESMLNMFLKKEKIDSVLNVAMEYVDNDHVKLADGTELPYSFAMIMPPFVGQDFLKETGLADDKGYVMVRDTYQTPEYDDIYAVGIAAQVNVPWQTPIPVGIPKTGFPTEQMAHVAAKNVAAQIRGEQPQEHKEFGDIPAICVMDAGNNGVMILADHMLPPRKHGVLIPGPQNHAMKLGFEKYSIWKMKHGHVNLP
jgi:sulfide:quinone oxidoreductase